MTEDNNLGLEFKYLIVNDMDRKFGLWVNTSSAISLSSRFSLSTEGTSVRFTISMPKKEESCGISIGLLQRARFVFFDSTPERQGCKVG